MAKRKEVLLPVDGSKRSEYVVEWAVKNLLDPQKDQVTVLLVQSHPDMCEGVFIGKDASLSQDAVESLKTHVSTASRNIVDRAVHLCETHKVPAKAKVEIGDPREKIVQWTKEQPVDLVVLGSRGLGFIKRAMLGSVASYCLHHVACSVAIIKAPGDLSVD